ncbi:MAG: hypothetical protein HKN96_04045 [Flavobacteriaceae bacterium]|nr:hypothetical protein [Flavobacteriaceae bacterium]NNK27035.1 hypothetical protein [Flavobacteriaceae bacterium]
MNISVNFRHIIVAFLVFSFGTTHTMAQKKKKIKRPSSRVGITSVDRFVRESFDIYDKVYMYDGYAEAGKPLSDDDIDVLERADGKTFFNKKKYVTANYFKALENKELKIKK